MLTLDELRAEVEDGSIDTVVAAFTDMQGRLLGKHYKWINPIAFIWIIFIAILFIMPITPTGIPWHSGFDWNVVNYAPITVGGVLLLVGMWWALSARKWFKGPVVEGTEQELERIEAAYEGTVEPATVPG